MASIRESVEDNEIIKTLKLLEEGKDKIQLDKNHTDITLALGITGSGKSTFVQWLAGDDSKLISEPVKGSKVEFIIKDGNRISNSTTESKTIFPELVVDRQTGAAFYDCPGFSDTRSASNDIASTFFIKTVSDFAQKHQGKVKLLFVVGYPSVRSGVDRRDFTQLLSHSTDMIKDVDKFAGSIAMVVTKVDNLYYPNEEGGFELESDQSVIETIANFLVQVKEELAARSTEESKMKIKFVDVLLQKDEGQGYSKIQIFRRPNKKGPLNEIPLLVNLKKAVAKMVTNLQFSPINMSDFGYTISDNSKNIINGLVREINDYLWKDVEEIAQKLGKFYLDSTKNITDKIKSFSTKENLILPDSDLIEAKQFSDKLSTGFQAISDLVNEVGKLTTIKDLGEKINSTLTGLDNCATCQANVDHIILQARYFDFLQGVSDTPLNTRQWDKLLTGVVELIQLSTQNIQTEVNASFEKLINNINTNVDNVAAEFWQAKLNKIKLIEIQKLPAKLDQDQVTMRNMKDELLKLGNSTDQLVTVIGKNANLLEVETEVVKRNTLDIVNRGKQLSYLQAVSGGKLPNGSSDWVKPFNQTLDSLADTGKWYRFLNDMYSKFGEYQIQHDPTQYNVADLNNWGEGKGKSQGIQITGDNFQQFLTKISKYNITEFKSVQDKGASLTDWKLQDLNQLLSLTLKQRSNPSCQQSNTLVITGDYVRLSDFVQTNGKVIRPEGCSPQLKSINVFASNRLFIDQSLQEVGSKLKLTVISPNWEIIGNERKIVLDGAAGAGMSKAENGKQPGNAGGTGKPGLPGGSAGSFLAIGNIIHNAAALTVDVNGGVGGAGQEGGDGVAGERGNDASPPSEGCTLTGKYRKTGSHSSGGEGGCRYISYSYRMEGAAGDAGGAGGDGGVGGVGGRSGNVIFFNLTNSGDLGFKHSNRTGDSGASGKGGIGGNGGKNGDEIDAKCSEMVCFFITFSRTLDSKSPVAITSRGSSGKTGSNGANKAGTTDPENAAIIEDPAKIMNGYKMYLRENLYDVNGRFKRNYVMNFLDQLNENTQVKQSYNTLSLADELQGMEQQFRRGQKQKTDQVHFYESLRKRIEEYAKSPRPEEKSDQHKKLLNYLYAATYSKLYNLRVGTESNMIINVEGYLAMAQENINTLNELLKQNTANGIVQRHKQKYQENINKQIEEAEQFIEKDVTPAFDQISTKIDEQIAQLIKDTVQMQEKAEENKKELIKMKDKLQNQLVLRGVFSALKGVSAITSFMGPQGMAVGMAIGTLGSAGEAFLLDDQTAAQKPLNLPPAVKDSIKLLETNSKFCKDQIVKEFKDKLEAVKQEIKGDSLLDELRKKVDERKKWIDEQETDKPELTEKIKEVQKKLRDEYKTTEEGLKLKEKEADAANALKRMQRVNQVAQMSSLALEIYSKFRGDLAKIDANNDALREAEKQLQQLEAYKKEIYSSISPKLDTLQHDMKDIQAKLGTVSQVALDINQWKVQGMIGDMKVYIRKVTKGQSIEEDMVRSIDKLDEAMTTMIKLYDRIQNYQQQQQLASYIANINSPEYNRVNITDPVLTSAVNRLEILIRSNVALQRHDSTIVALKQTVFPYAHLYLESISPLASNLNLLTENDKKEESLNDLVTNAVAQLEKIRTEVSDNRNSIGKLDKYKNTAVFDGCPLDPFYEWSNEKHRAVLEVLLRGDSVAVRADVRNSAPDMDAIKFNLIEVSFKAKNETAQKELDTELKQFRVSAIHMGNSYYRYNDKYYIISNAPQDMQYSFARQANGEPVMYNDVYKKIRSGDLMLSPYAMWSIKLLKLNQNDKHTFDKLTSFSGAVDLRLIGNGTFIEANSGVTSDELHVGQYYQEYDNTEDQTGEVQDVRSQYKRLQIAALKKMKLKPCGIKPNLTGFSAQTKNKISNPSIEGSGASGANLIELSSNSIDVNGNLLLGQLLVGSLMGKNRSLTNELYMSPEQRRLELLDKLAHKVLPSLSVQSKARYQHLNVQQDNPNTEWFKHLFSQHNNDTIYSDN